MSDEFMSQPESLEPIQCRCGGEPTQPEKVPHCHDRWIIRCQVERCLARNIGQSRSAVIIGWNRLSSSFYR
ncbi:hypothetical protein [Neptunicella sp. SCSIO 80796]|uniref:hypothetical protein n=1 Tax=Neptunicella plasticusilytica TaxID=3117012 RepID=UPI003A4DC630